MLESTQKFIWLAVGVAIWITAITYTWTGIVQINQLLQISDGLEQSQNRTVYEDRNDSIGGSYAETYSRAQVLGVLQDSFAESIDVEFEGKLYSPDSMNELVLPMDQISMSRTYEAILHRDHQGNITKVTFQTMN